MGEVLLLMEAYSKQMDKLYQQIIQVPSPSTQTIIKLWEEYIIQTRDCLGMFDICCFLSSAELLYEYFRIRIDRFAIVALELLEAQRSGTKKCTWKSDIQNTTSDAYKICQSLKINVDRCKTWYSTADASVLPDTAGFTVSFSAPPISLVRIWISTGSLNWRYFFKRSFTRPIQHKMAYATFRTSNSDYLVLQSLARKKRTNMLAIVFSPCRYPIPLPSHVEEVIAYREWDV